MTFFASIHHISARNCIEKSSLAMHDISFVAVSMIFSTFGSKKLFYRKPVETSHKQTRCAHIFAHCSFTAHAHCARPAPNIVEGMIFPPSPLNCVLANTTILSAEKRLATIFPFFRSLQGFQELNVPVV